MRSIDIKDEKQQLKEHHEHYEIYTLVDTFILKTYQVDWVIKEKNNSIS